MDRTDSSADRNELSKKLEKSSGNGCTVPFMPTETLFHGQKRYVDQKPAASAPGGRRAASRGLGYLLGSQRQWSDVSDRGRRPGSEDRPRFPCRAARMSESTDIHAALRSSQVRSFPSITLKSRRSAPTAAGAFCCSRKLLRVSSSSTPRRWRRLHRSILW